MIRITDSAAAHLRALLASRGETNSGAGLRLMVQRGGCAGLKYAMKIDQASTGDEIVTHAGVAFFVDAQSLAYLKGCEVDYQDSLSDAGFRIHNPNAARSCGCGTSFEPNRAGTLEPAAAVPDGEACASEKLP